MKPEAAFRSAVVRALRELHAVPVENPVHPGTPDINCRLGWLELKVDEARADGTVPLKHLTPQQKVFMVQRSRAGGLSALLLKVGEEIFLLDAPVACGCPGQSLNWFRAMAFRHWPSCRVAPSDQELQDALWQLARRFVA